MLRIRLRRVGRKHDPSYQVIVAEKGRGPQTGDFVEKVGTYDARSDEYDLKDERITYWLSEGAQPTDTVHNLIAKAGITDADTVNPLPQKSPVTQEQKEEEEEENKAEDEEAQETTDTPEENTQQEDSSDDDSSEESDEEETGDDEAGEEDDQGDTEEESEAKEEDEDAEEEK